jgi:hypothetical protein
MAGVKKRPRQACSECTRSTRFELCHRCVRRIRRALDRAVATTIGWLIRTETIPPLKPLRRFVAKHGKR